MLAPQPTAYDRKARLYAENRWDYPQDAIDQILQLTGIGPLSIVADIGAGPGILTRHFLPIAAMVYAVEPSPAMREVADERLWVHANYRRVRGSAEATTLPDANIDLITVGMALHWFEPSATRQEFRRILKPTGHIAILRYKPVEQDIIQALAAIPGRSVPAPHAADASITDFIEPATLTHYTYTTTHREDLSRFLNAQLSTANAPDMEEPQYNAYCDAVRSVFARHASDGLLTITQRTHLDIGQLRRA